MELEKMEIAVELIEVKRKVLEILENVKEKELPDEERQMVETAMQRIAEKAAEQAREIKKLLEICEFWKEYMEE